MYRRHNTRTDLQIVNDGDFVKVGKKHYRHVSGKEITYNCNTWSWMVDGVQHHSLEWAVFQVRKIVQSH